MDKKYYWLLLEQVIDGGQDSLHNFLAEEHPILFVKTLNEKSNMAGIRFVLIDWNEISEEEYNLGK